MILFCSKHWTKQTLINDWLKCRVAGFFLKQRVAALAIAYKPQSCSPNCFGISIGLGLAKDPKRLLIRRADLNSFGFA